MVAVRAQRNLSRLLTPFAGSTQHCSCRATPRPVIRTWRKSRVSSLSYVEAIVVGLFQGVTELFPVSSLGHSVLVPALIGGQWAKDLNVSAPQSPYLAFIVGLHVATALALIAYFLRDWLGILGGGLPSML